MITFDKTAESVVITCDDCGEAWASAHSNLNAAARASLIHERDVHSVSPGNTQGYAIIYSATRRGRNMSEVWENI
jgi:hypothetical protein